jgi:cell division protein FtsB
MRETKDQKIIRLERKIEKLENYIRELKAGSRQLKKNVKLGMNIKETSHKSDIANLNKEMNRLISENSRLQKSITDLEEEKKGFIIRLKNSNKSKEEIRFEENE